MPVGARDRKSVKKSFDGVICADISVNSYVAQMGLEIHARAHIDFPIQNRGL